MLDDTAIPVGWGWPRRVGDTGSGCQMVVRDSEAIDSSRECAIGGPGGDAGWVGSGDRG